MSSISGVSVQRYNRVYSMNQRNFANGNTYINYSVPFTSQSEDEVSIKSSLKDKLENRLKDKSEKVQKNFAEIFGKENLTKEETEKLVQEYKELFKIKDEDEFTKQAFIQMKKDFGYEYSNIKLKINNDNIMRNLIKNHGMVEGGFQFLNHITVNSKNNKDIILMNLAHEFNHMRQAEYMFRTDKDRCIKHITELLIEFDPKIKNMHDENPEEFNKSIEEFLNEMFNSPSEFIKGSPEYIQGQKYFEANSTYLNDKKNLKDYQNNLLEKESSHVGKLMQEVALYIKFTTNPV